MIVARQDKASRFHRPDLHAVSARIGQFFVRDETSGDEAAHDRALRARHVRVLAPIVGITIVTFIPSLPVAGVPPERWVSFIAAAIVASAVISWSFVMVRRDTRVALAAAAIDAGVIVGLNWMIGDFYHQLVLLFALVVAGQAAIHGTRAAFVMVLSGSVVVPLTVTANLGNNPTDALYAFIFLMGLVAILWIKGVVEERSSRALRTSENKYRELVERVPAIVYSAGLGSEGLWHYVSPHVEELLGFPAEAWTSDPGFWFSRVHPEDRERVLADEFDSWELEPGERTRVEYRLLQRDGGVRWVMDEAAVVAGEDGRPSHWGGFLVDVTDRKTLEDQLQHQAFHDRLTGLANRSLFIDRVEHALARSRRARDSVAVLFLDLDDFKTVNDGLGHEAGDELLVVVGATLRGCLRPGDTVARLGGDEFAVLVEDQETIDGAIAAAERILEALAQPIRIQRRDVVIGASIGIAERVTRHDTASEILRNADSAMYAAKRLGKGRHAIYAPAMHAAAVQRLELAEEIRLGLGRGEFEVYYQPAVLLDNGQIAGFEALVRWNHPVLGLIMPGEFIGVAEDSGQIVPLGRFVLEQACRQAGTWQRTATGGTTLTMSVNVSPRQFRDPSLCPSVAASIAAAGIDPTSLILEITEGIAMDDTDTALERLREIKALGVRLAIDDFGTGYSSLSYLRRLPIDILKMDKSFVDPIARGGEALKLARVIVRMGLTLHLETVAEGVEHQTQAAALRRMGCAQAQGYYFARPMPADEVTALLSGPVAALPRAG